jgi:hypothetical protein
MLVSEIFCTALTKGNPFVKQEIFQWLATSLPDGKGLNKVYCTLIAVQWGNVVTFFAQAILFSESCSGDLIIFYVCG